MLSPLNARVVYKYVMTERTDTDTFWSMTGTELSAQVRQKDDARLEPTHRAAR